MSGIDKTRIVGQDPQQLDQLMCGICDQLLDNPMVTTCCRRLYCKCCDKEWLNVHQNCPNECTTVTTNGLTRLVANVIDSMEVKCMFAPRGCPTVHTIAEEREHLKNCVYGKGHPSVRSDTHSLVLEDKPTVEEPHDKPKSETTSTNKPIEGVVPIHELKNHRSETRDLEEEVQQLRQCVNNYEQSWHELEAKKQMLAEEKKPLKLNVQMKALQEQLEMMGEEAAKKAGEHEREMQEMRQRLESAADEYRHVFGTCEELRAKNQKLKDNTRKPVESSRADAGDHVTTRVKALQSTSSEERVTAEDEQWLPCDVCSEHVLGRAALVQHLEQNHAQRLCPMCALPFDTRVSDHEQIFEMHVQSHLDT